MDTLEKRRIERELKMFAERHLENPRKCRDLRQIQFYIRELSLRIDELKKNFNYVPDFAYTLLAEYNQVQNSALLRTFQRLYS